MSLKEYTLKQLADFLSAELHGDGDFKVAALATLEQAGSSDLSFIANSKYQKYLSDTQAGAVLMTPADQGLFKGNALVIDNPYLAYARVSQLFVPSSSSLKGIAASANIAESARIAKTASIAHGVVVGEHSVVGDGVVIGPNSVVGDDCVIGAESVINANVTLYTDVHIGENCLIHSGAVLGADGFGFANEAGSWVKIAQLGGVRVGNNVEIGAGTTVDRGALEHTIISDGVILDNQIQIAHNVTIGEKSAIAGCTAIAGSTKIGAGCTIAGACGITGHLNIAAGSHITAMSLVTKSITEPGVYSSGTGMLPHKKWKKNVVRFRQLDDLARRLKSVEDKITEIKGS
ncbi:UDP-3-O-(3-hydroxymyristoyl)glucosamine N-acyltransferase [Neptuniibacter sp. PT8_73]|uniref:UDP-3-O-(3-hydroxymyristoyl)glucosamine N-acyltransferase n=1 Tax=unclassified Neptuniibacter TaxID=2630693 RepID=UPI0039F67343